MQDLIMQCKAQPEAASVMLDALNALFAKGPSSEVVGICANVQYYLYLDSRFADDEDWLPLLWASWPEWSGTTSTQCPPAVIVTCAGMNSKRTT